MQPAFDEALAFNFIKGLGALPPWLCIGNNNTVLDKNGCAEAFFTDTDHLAKADDNGVINGPDKAKYWIGGPLWNQLGIAYNPAVTGEVNMRNSSVKIIQGNGAIRKNNPATLTWP